MHNRFPYSGLVASCSRFAYAFTQDAFKVDKKDDHNQCKSHMWIYIYVFCIFILFTNI